MVSEVKILWFSHIEISRPAERNFRQVLGSSDIERMLPEMLNQGWTIIASGSAGLGMNVGYIILKREES